MLLARRLLVSAGSNRVSAGSNRVFSTLVRQHDLGGLSSLLEAPVPADDPLHVWELEAHALYASLAKNGHFSTDEARRTIESFTPHAYAQWGYYEKFSAAAANLLHEKRLIKPGELEAEVYGELAPRAFPTYAPGDAVRVRSEDAHATTWRRPHLRTPGYLFGATGIVERLMGEFADPSLLAYGIGAAPAVPLYRVRFRLGDLWSEAEPEEAGSSVTVDLYANWLEQPSGGRGDKHEDEAEAAVVINAPGYHQGHLGHGHGTRQQIERAACEAEGPPRPGSAVHEALKRLAIRNGLVSAEQLRTTMEGLETAGMRLYGASLVVAAWKDSGFKQRLLADGNAAAAERGIVAANPNAPTKVVVVENTSEVHNLVVCTL